MEQVMRLSGLIAVFSFVTVLASASWAAHPASGSDCVKCHNYDSNVENGRVIPEEPGFFAKMLFGAQWYKGHQTLKCAGSKGADGKLTGCHAPELGFKKHLVMNLNNKSTDELCGECHQANRAYGAHHPSYKMDKNGDGIGEYIVRPAEVQEIFKVYDPSKKGKPLSRYPDSLVFITLEDKTKKLDVALPLDTTVEIVDKKEVTYTGVISCVTCHNPHYGYLVEVGSEEKLKADIAARAKGDALLRLRDYTNSLCEACH